MIIRPLQHESVDELVSLWNEAVPSDPVLPYLMQEKVWGDAGFDPGLTAACYVDKTLVGFAMAVERPLDGKSMGVVKMLAVAPVHRRRGAGSMLYRAIEAKLLERGATEVRVAESPPNYLTPGIDEQATEATAFFNSHGFEAFNTAVNMAVRLRDNAAIGSSNATNNGIQVLRYTPRWKSRVDALLSANWPSWAGEFYAAADRETPTAFIAVDDDRAIGFAVHDANNRETGWFGPMGADPSRRGLGVGKALLIECLRDMQSNGVHTATIPWVGPTEFYTKLVGARVCRTFIRMRKPLRPTDVGGIA